MESFEKQSSTGGVIVESGTSAITGDFCAIQVLVAATFTVFTENNSSGDVMTGFAIPAGTILRGHITAFTMSSGTVRAHRRDVRRL